jgi:hypothetical protein
MNFQESVDTSTSSMSGTDTQLPLPRPNPEVIFNTVAGGGVLLHTQAELYFGLNSVGSRVWQLLPPECDGFGELCDRLHSDYPEVDRGRIAADVSELLENLRRHDLVVAN